MILQGLQLEPTYLSLLATLDAPDTIKRPVRVPVPYLEAILGNIGGAEEAFGSMDRHQQRASQLKAAEARVEEMATQTQSSLLTREDLIMLNQTQPIPQTTDTRQLLPYTSAEDRAEMLGVQQNIELYNRLTEQHAQRQRMMQETRAMLHTQHARERDATTWYDIFDPEEIHIPSVPVPRQGERMYRLGDDENPWADTLGVLGDVIRGVGIHGPPLVRAGVNGAVQTANALATITPPMLSLLGSIASGTGAVARGIAGSSPRSRRRRESRGIADMGRGALQLLNEAIPVVS
jgi:hypothetical protein